MVNVKPVKVGRKTRMSFAKINEVMQMPNLIEIQKNSYQWFLDTGLREVFKDIDKDTYAVLDTIIRALGSYGLNHSCYYLECSDPVLYPTLSALRFEQKDGMMKSDLSKILNKCH